MFEKAVKKALATSAGVDVGAKGSATVGVVPIVDMVVGVGRMMNSPHLAFIHLASGKAATGDANSGFACP
jgi:hypothetical protein